MAVQVNRRRFLGMGLAAGAASLLGCGPQLLQGGSLQGIPHLAGRVRLRQLGIRIGELETGGFNAVTDVPGIRVGHVTLIQGEGPLQVGQGPVRTGVTAILPPSDQANPLTRQPLHAADFTLNGNGELTGVGPVRRTGLLAAPILFTNTSSVGAVYDGAMGHMLEADPDLFRLPWQPEPVVGETWADFLNDTAGGHVKAEHAVGAISAAQGGPVAEGSVGGGTGMRSYSFKAGIGTASRLVPCGAGTFTVGVLVQANHGRRRQLVIDGVPVGRLIPELKPERGIKTKSLLIAVVTDAPLLPVQLRRLCKRAALGMARTGAISTHGSGDLFIAFSTASQADRQVKILRDRHITGMHQGVVEATEEAILNALCAAETMVGRDGNTIHALPLDRLVEIMRDYGRIK
jgi:D-aminopeptidase